MVCFTLLNPKQNNYNKFSQLKQTIMKKLILLCTISFVAIFSKAQNVAINNDGTAAAASAMLDVKSTTKGMMMPRMTTAQRTAVAAPAIGLLVFDTDTKTIWAHDGASWKNLYTSGGGLILPFAQTVNTGTSALQVTNQGIGAAIEGSSSAEFGTGLTAKATGAGAWGLYAFSNGEGAKSINSFADNGSAFHGENNNPANTNTLINTINRGSGKTASFQLVNTASTSFNVQIAGNNLGEQLKIFQTNALNTLPAVSIINSGTGDGVNASSTTGPGIVGTSNTNYGIKGVTNTATGFAGVYGQNTGTAGSGVIGTSNAVNTQGVYGSSVNGIAVRALGDNYRAVQAVSNTGTALYGSSTSGLGLEVNGNVKIAGGNTNPVAGAVLTSDANGNATWKTGNRIAFRGFDINGSYLTIPNQSYQQIYYAYENYDLSGSFVPFDAGVKPPNPSTFSIPADGIYHFEASANLFYDTDDFDANATIYLQLNRNGVFSNLAYYTGSKSPVLYPAFQTGTHYNLKVSGDFQLFPGDKVTVVVGNFNDDDKTAVISKDIVYAFTGNIVVAY
jgi:hypothetical protein